MANRDVAVLAASAGGLEALRAVLGGLPPDHEGVVLVVLHMAPAGGSTVADILDRSGPLPAREAVDGEALEPGRVYVCKADHHLLVADGHVLVRKGPKENGHRPAADPLFRSVARYHGPRAVGVVLSGTLSDGTSGLYAVRRAGGVAVVQSPEDALFEGMPTSALEQVGADHVLTAAEIGPLLGRLALEPAPDRGGMQEDLPKEVALMEIDDSVVEGAHPGRPSEWPCPDCDGVLWEIEEGDAVRFRCRVGHAWSAEALLHQQRTKVEAALWMALRALEDRAALSRAMVARAEESGRTMSAERFKSDLDDLDESIGILRHLVQHEEVPHALEKG